MLTTSLMRISNRRFVAFLAVGVAFLVCLHLGLLTLILSIFLGYELVHRISNSALSSISHEGRRKSLAGVGITLILLLLIASFFGGIFFAGRGGIDPHGLIEKIAEITASLKLYLPQSISNMLPIGEDVLSHAASLLKTHAGDMGTVGINFLKQIGYMVIGVIIGIVMAVFGVTNKENLGQASFLMAHQFYIARTEFWRIVIAQAKISLVNTFFTLVYLFAILPAFGVTLPFRKTLVILTFSLGLLPIVGNLLSNIAITLISIGYSFPVAIGSLAFLIVVHKMEYFLNARIVSTVIHSRIWETLLAMVLMESLFGIPGVIAAPIFYSWAKSEWHAWDKKYDVTAPTFTQE
jgi:predicted PurR-regulated permease PerM